MANFAYDIRQKMAVNLDLIDAIQNGTDSEGKHFISFHRQVGIADQSVSGVVASWTFESEEDRDKTYVSIVTSNGMSYGSKGFSIF